MKIPKRIQNVTQQDRGRLETHNAVDECQLGKEDYSGGQIDQIQQAVPPHDRLVARRKFKTEMEKQRRQKKARTQIRPENGPVKRVEFTRKVERIKNKRRQANQIEVQRMRRTGTLQ